MKKIPQNPSIFLSYSEVNKRKAHKLHKRLTDDGFDVWIDKENLQPGEDWKMKIKQAMHYSSIVLICLSKKAIEKTGYFQTEIKMAINHADEMPQGKIYLVPIRLELCELPSMLQTFQWVDVFLPPDKGYDRLVNMLREQIGRPSRRIVPKDKTGIIKLLDIKDQQVEETNLTITIKGKVTRINRLFIVEAVVIHCIDFRLQEYLNHWLVQRFGERSYDRVSLAGGIKDIDSIIKQVEISHRLHETRKAILINHEDCGAYGAEGTKERHAIDLAEAESKIKALFPSLDIERYYLHLDGTFELMP